MNTIQNQTLVYVAPAIYGIMTILTGLLCASFSITAARPSITQAILDAASQPLKKDRSDSFDRFVAKNTATVKKGQVLAKWDLHLNKDVPKTVKLGKVQTVNVVATEIDSEYVRIEPSHVASSDKVLVRFHYLEPVVPQTTLDTVSSKITLEGGRQATVLVATPIGKTDFVVNRTDGQITMMNFLPTGQSPTSGSIAATTTDSDTTTSAPSTTVQPLNTIMFNVTAEVNGSIQNSVNGVPLYMGLTSRSPGVADTPAASTLSAWKLAAGPLQGTLQNLINKLSSFDPAKVSVAGDFIQTKLKTVEVLKADALAFQKEIQDIGDANDLEKFVQNILNVGNMSEETRGIVRSLVESISFNDVKSKGTLDIPILAGRSFQKGLYDTSNLRPNTLKELEDISFQEKIVACLKAAGRSQGLLARPGTIVVHKDDIVTTDAERVNSFIAAIGDESDKVEVKVDSVKKTLSLVAKEDLKPEQVEKYLAEFSALDTRVGAMRDSMKTALDILNPKASSFAQTPRVKAVDTTSAVLFGGLSLYFAGKTWFALEEAMNYSSVDLRDVTSAADSALLHAANVGKSTLTQTDKKPQQIPRSRLRTIMVAATVLVSVSLAGLGVLGYFAQTGNRTAQDIIRRITFGRHSTFF